MPPSNSRESLLEIRLAHTEQLLADVVEQMYMDDEGDYLLYADEDGEQSLVNDIRSYLSYAASLTMT